METPRVKVNNLTFILFFRTPSSSKHPGLILFYFFNRKHPGLLEMSEANTINEQR